EDYLCSFDDIGDAVQALQDAGIPCAKVYDIKDVCTDPHFVSQGWITELPVPDDIHSQATYTTRGPIAGWTVEPPVMGKEPLLGQHNLEILESVGYSAEDAQALEDRWTAAAKAKKK
ncbi:MAG: CoA transferase, partial [Oscillospiraceae bacterium]|nr:CoA transferase [Oscillospiraceae bacterium]